MQSAVVFVAFLAAATATVQYTTVPQLGSAVVTNQRVGGNFAYTIGQQPAVAYTSGYPYNTPVVYTTGASGVPAVQKVAQYAAYPASTVVAGTPASTYKTVAGVSPITYNNLGYNGVPVVGVNGLGYAGYPGVVGYNGYTGYNGLNAYNGVNGYTTVY